MALKKIPFYLKGLADRYCRTKAEAESHLLSYNTAIEMAAYHQELADEAGQALKETKLKNGEPLGAHPELQFKLGYF